LLKREQALKEKHFQEWDIKCQELQQVQQELLIQCDPDWGQQFCEDPWLVALPIQGLMLEDGQHSCAAASAAKQRMKRKQEQEM